MIQATGVILAGGKSVRMGTDKAFLNVGRKGMIERVAGELKNVFAEVLISGGDMETGRRLGLKVVTDIIKGCGPLGGIYTALYGASYEKCLVVACDMPFIRAGLARFMMQQAEGYDVAVPRQGVYLQPLFAVYSVSCLPAIEKSLSAARYKVTDFYPQVRVNYVDEEKFCSKTDFDTVFLDVNTPVDLIRAREITGGK